MQAMETRTDEDRVLVVDDDPEVVELVSSYLGRIEDLTVETTTDPERAITSVEQRSFSCIVSDYEMPGMDGLEVLAAVREREGDVPFVLFTNADDDTLSERASERDAIYVEKGMRAEQYQKLAECVQQTVTAH